MTPQIRAFIADLSERTGITTSELVDMFRKHGKTRTPVKKFSGKGSRVGKLGTVRLKGRELTDLRVACFERDRFHCRECGGQVYPDFSPRAEMAHIRTKRNHGDTLDNVRTLCPECHAKEHNAGGKPCPKKP